tara:strand:- start:2275 stop:2646 length:372 start_codon:yes stop_codon:yes gene_type:complete
MAKFKPLSLRKAIGSTYNTDFDDIRNIKEALREVGLYEAPNHGITPYGDEPLFNSIRRYQGVNRLQVDGVAKPDGETQRELNRTLEELRVAAKSPIYRCIDCGGPHGGAYGSYCWWCYLKLNS